MPVQNRLNPASYFSLDIKKFLHLQFNWMAGTNRFRTGSWYKQNSPTRLLDAEATGAATCLFQVAISQNSVLFMTSLFITKGSITLSIFIMHMTEFWMC